MAAPDSCWYLYPIEPTLARLSRLASWMSMRATLPPRGVAAQVVSRSMVMLANRYEIVLVERIVVTGVMNV